MRLFLCLAVIGIISTPAFCSETKQISPDDKFSVTLAASQWQAIIIANKASDALTAHQASDIEQQIYMQINAQSQKPAADKKVKP